MSETTPEPAPESLILVPTQNVVFGSNRFVGVPIILQYQSTPLIEVVKFQKLGFGIQIPIFGPDGTKLAVAKGGRLFTTENGEKAGLSLRHLANATVCELGKKTIFEITRNEASALSVSAELHTPDGHFIRSKAGPPGLFSNDGTSLRVGEVTMTGNVIQGFPIGVWIGKGRVAIGVNRPPV